MGGQANPVGASVSSHIEESREDPEFRAEYDRLRPYEEFARVVIRRRAELGFSQEDLAARAGVPSSTVSQIESGQHVVDFHIARRLSKVLGIEVPPKRPSQAEDPT